MAASTNGPGMPPSRGRSLVVGLVLLGLAAAATGIGYQRWQTGRCLEFYGPEVARLVAILCGPDAAWFNGATLDFTGGMSQGLLNLVHHPR